MEFKVKLFPLNFFFIVTEVKDGYSKNPKIYTAIENKENITPRQPLCSHSAFSTHHDLIYLFNKYLYTDLYNRHLGYKCK